MDAHAKPTARGRERDAVLRLRRRQKLERYIAALCTGGGITLEVARDRQRAAVEILKGYDSDKNGGSRGPRDALEMEARHPQQHNDQNVHQHQKQHHLSADNYQHGKQQKQFLPDGHDGDHSGRHHEPAHSHNQHGADMNAGRGGYADGGGGHKASDARWTGGTCTPVHSQPGGANGWAPSNIRYGGLSPRLQREDVVMPRRPKGEVDEWAAIVKVQEERAQRGKEEQDELKRAHQRQYFEDMHLQLDDKRRREEEARRDKERDLIHAKEEMDRHRELELQLRHKSKDEQQRIRDMFAQQAMQRQQALRMEKEARLREEQRALQEAQAALQHSDAKDAAAKEGRRQQMLRARADVEAQVRERQLLKERERLVDKAYAEEYARVTEAEERRREEAEDKRRSRIGRLERLSDDNAQKEQARLKEEDRRFLEDLVRRQEQGAAEERRKLLQALQNKAEYGGMLHESMEERRQRHLRDRLLLQARESAVAEAEAEAARVAAEQERQRKTEQQQLYAQHLRAQMAEDIEKRRHQYRMSEKERLLNRGSMDLFVSERGLLPSSHPSQPPLSSPHQQSHAGGYYGGGGGGGGGGGVPYHGTRDVTSDYGGAGGDKYRGAGAGAAGGAYEYQYQSQHTPPRGLDLHGGGAKVGGIEVGFTHASQGHSPFANAARNNYFK